MKNKIIEILKQYVDFSAYDRGGTSEVLYNKLAADLSAAFEQHLRDELIKVLNDEQVRFTYGVITDEEVIDNYLNSREK